jgi:hypothetical protein
METDIQGIPYNSWIEVPFTVTNAAIGLCNEFKDISVSITATCEASSSSSQVYQYGVIYDPVTRDVSIDYGTIVTAASSSATFNVEWPAGSVRRKLTADGMEDMKTMEAVMDAKIDRVNSFNSYVLVGLMVGVLCTLAVIVYGVFFKK